MQEIIINKPKLVKLLKSDPIVSMDCNYCPVPKSQKVKCDKRIFADDYHAGGKECPGIILKWLVK